MTATFVHLHLHTEYSLVDGLIRVKALVKAARAAGMPAVAVTDQGNLFAMVKFYKAALAAGIKPIVGVDAWVENPADPSQPVRLVLLCMDAGGYRNLSVLVSKAYLENQRRGVPVMKREWFDGLSDGLIALSGGREGDVGQALLAGRPELAEELLAEWSGRFPDRYYLELQRTGREGEDNYLRAAVELAAARGVPVVASNDVRFLVPDDYEAHEVRVCIHESRTLDDPRRPRHHTDQQYLKSPAEMAELFADLPEALENSVEIARRCNLQLRLGEYFLPDFGIPAGMTMEEYFAHVSREGLEERLQVILDPNAPDFAEQRKPYDERLERELGVIIQMGFPGYFLIVADFILWAKQNGVPVGPGRGSGAGSLVAYALKITDLDPLKYDLLFERFLNPERVSMPDFDVDFCMEGRDRVIDYVAHKYGRDHVSQIITYGSMAAKAVVRDVGRVLGHPYGFVDKVAKLIPFELGMTLDKALEQEEELKRRYEEEEDIHALIDMARKLEGLSRNAGKHAGGVVIAPTPLTEFSPLYCEQGGHSLVTQFDKDDVEAVGLVKFDFLGLRTLTIIDWAVQTINRQRMAQGEGPLDISRIVMDDPASFKLLKECATTAVFQLESRGMKDLIKRLQPDCFEDIVALVALFRPGPLQSGMVDDFINRKHGRAKVEYPHPALEPILKPTYGVILYQEQVMQIAQVLAGYTLGGADLLRRAMGKKKAEEMAKQRAIFTKGSLERGVEEATATYIFDLMEKFAGYGFNKSHSAAYALVSYQTAWLKAHYPAAFMAAVLSSDMDNTDKVVTFIEECKEMGLTVEPPDVNAGDYHFTVRDDRTIVYGLGAIKGVGEGAIEGVLEARRSGPFSDLFDFCRRIDLKRANRRVLEALIRAGAVDGFGHTRATHMASLGDALQAAEQSGRDHEQGQNDLFGGPVQTPEAQLTRMAEWPEEQRLQGEKETLGLYLTGHPIQRFLPEFERMHVTRISNLTPERNRSVWVAGLIVAMRTMNTRRGDRMAFVTLDDRSARIELALFSELYEENRDRIAKDRIVLVEGEVSVDDYTGGQKMSAKRILDVDEAREIHARCLRLEVDAARAGNGFIGGLQQALKPFCEGRCPVRVEYHRKDASATLELGEGWRVRPAEALLERLRELGGAVHLDY